MKNNLLNTIIIAILSFSFLSCEKIVFDGDKQSTNPRENFEYLWNQCNEKYSYFDVKNINWDSIKTIYSAKIYTGMSNDSLFNVLGSMLNELRDDHTNLVSSFNASAYRINYRNQDNFEWRTVVDNYISKNYITTGPFKHNFIDNGNIGYIRFEEFTGTVDNQSLDYILNRYKNTKGLILDIRENGGGVATDIFSILSRFVDTRTLLYYSRVKNGKGRNDFSEPLPAYVDPSSNVRYTQKVAVLTDRGTYSSGSYTSLATKALEKVILIGDTTGGGLGIPNGGQLPNGWTYRFSISQALTLDKNPNFENGVVPDILQFLDRTNTTKDAIIEKAIEELKR